MPIALYFLNKTAQNFSFRGLKKVNNEKKEFYANSMTQDIIRYKAAFPL